LTDAWDFLEGGGLMAERIRKHDWSSSPLGPIPTWPQALRTALGIMLGSGFPTYVVWGPSLVSFHNDAYLPVLGSRPDAIGVPVPQVWPDIWDALGPVVADVLRGEARSYVDLPLTTMRNGYPEQTWSTCSYSPIRDGTGQVGGLFCTVHDTTDRVIRERRLKFLVDLRERLRDLTDPRDVVSLAAEMLGRTLGADRVGYGEVDDGGEVLAVERDWTSDGTPSFAGRHRLADFGEGPIDELRNGNTLRIDDVLTDPRTAEKAALGGCLLTVRRASLVVPLVKEGRWCSVLYVHSAVPRHWQRHEVELAQDVADRTHEAVMRARAETAVKESEERYRQLFEAITQIAWSADTEGRVDFWNSRWSAYTGLTNEAGYNSGWAAAIHPDERQRIVETWSEAVRTSTPMEFEYRLRRADGAYRWHLERALPARDSGGNVVRWYGTVTDIDDLKRAEEALKQSEERFRRFAENSTSVLWTIDTATMRLDFLNASYRQVWGDRPEPMPWSYDAWMETIHPDDRREVAEALGRIRDEGAVEVKEYRIVRPDGTVRWIQNTGFPIRDDHGTVVLVAGIAHDITQHDGSMVYVVDGDEGSRRETAVLLQGAGYRVKSFATAQAFLDVASVLVPGCVIVDGRAPEAGDLRIPKEMRTRRNGLPVVMRGDARSDFEAAISAMKAGAADFVDVDSGRDRLLEAVSTALASIRDVAERDQAVELARVRISSLSERELAVLNGLLAGGTNKSIGRDLDISPRTVEAHRAKIMERLGAASLPDLVQIAVSAGMQAKQ